ncbi:MAG: hypothetical protein CMP76_02090 [Flavobacterium sp.]|uniref:hypothetical protein n=1 Tax=Flavobacterium sp. TaxID=239 RepID=UPI000C4DEA4A|nr:hypothetical protein [Flavobacterium sp.]MBF02064.1 hypothetical protein [Flavobacterium sp.]|tara:strand:+ start:247 stop:729 length:483 start_codon:yes stop_codon:yes gene_type:complete
MKLTTKTKIAIGLAAFGLITAYGSKKIADYQTVINNLLFNINSIYNVRVKGTKLLFYISVKFTNTTQYDFSINTLGLVAVKKIKVFRENVLIGEANSDITQIEILAFNSSIIKDITIETNYLHLMNELLDFEQFTDISKWKTEIVVEALGQTYILEQPLQ